MKKLSLKHIDEAHDALNIIYQYKGLRVDGFDFTAIFKKQPTQIQLKHLEETTKDKTFIQAIIVDPEFWAKEFDTELTIEFQKYLDKIRSSSKKK